MKKRRKKGKKMKMAHLRKKITWAVTFKVASPTLVSVEIMVSNIGKSVARGNIWSIMQILGKQ